MEYPGYSGDLTPPSEKTILKNAEQAIRYFKSIEDLPFVLFGESLGTTVATYLASHFEIQGLILQSPLPSLSDVGKRIYPFLPLNLLLKNNFKAKQWALKVKAKVLILHGEKDTIVPLELGRKQSLNFTPKAQFISFKNRGHNDLAIYNDLFWTKVRNFIEAL
jgi:pimeloyl-ACP methyl ester carboxylesterase